MQDDVNNRKLCPWSHILYYWWQEITRHS